MEVVQVQSTYARRPTREILAIAARVAPEKPYGAVHLRVEDDIQGFKHHKAARVGVQKTFDLMRETVPMPECAANVPRLFVAVDLGLVKDATDAALLKASGPFGTSMTFGGRAAAASFDEAAAIVGAGARTPGPAAAVVALVVVWRATPGIRSPAAAIFVLGAAVATIAAAPTVVTAAAVAAAAAAAAAAPPLPSALHATPAIVRAEASGP